MADANAIMNEEMPTMVLSPGLYDKLKLSVMIFIPAASSVYFGLDAIWDLPSEEKVIGTLALVATTLGTFLNSSRKRFMNSSARYDGVVDLNVDGGGVSGFTMNLKPSVGVEDLPDKDEVTFKINPVPVQE